MRYVGAAPGDLVDGNVITETAGTLHNLAAITECLLFGSFGISGSFFDMTFGLQFLPQGSSSSQLPFELLISVA